ncbi:MAG: hypothetical protein AAF380_01890 [Bacteroidota bacterium]
MHIFKSSTHLALLAILSLMTPELIQATTYKSPDQKNIEETIQWITSGQALQQLADPAYKKIPLEKLKQEASKKFLKKLHSQTNFLDDSELNKNNIKPQLVYMLGVINKTFFTYDAFEKWIKKKNSSTVIKDEEFEEYFDPSLNWADNVMHLIGRDTKYRNIGNYLMVLYDFRIHNRYKPTSTQKAASSAENTTKNPVEPLLTPLDQSKENPQVAPEKKPTGWGDFSLLACGFTGLLGGQYISTKQNSKAKQRKTKKPTISPALH